LNRNKKNKPLTKNISCLLLALLILNTIIPNSIVIAEDKVESESTFGISGEIKESKMENQYITDSSNENSIPVTNDTNEVPISESLENNNQSEFKSPNLNHPNDSIDINENKDISLYTGETTRAGKKIRDWFPDVELARSIANLLAQKPDNSNDYPYLPDASIDTIIDETILEKILIFGNIDTKLNIKKVKSLKGIEYLKNVEKLVLAINTSADIKDWDSLKGLSKLQYLWLDNVAVTNEQLSTFVPSLANQSLNTFEIWGDMINLNAPLKSIDFFNGLNSQTLTTVNLINMGIEDIKGISNFKGAANVFLEGNAITDISILAGRDALLHGRVNVSDQLVEKKEVVMLKYTGKDYRLDNPIKSVPGKKLSLTNISNGGYLDESTNEIVWNKDQLTDKQGEMSFTWNSDRSTYDFPFNGDYNFSYELPVDSSSIKTKDITLYQGQSWKPEDNFVSATDEDGNAVPWSDGRVDSNGASVDTSKPGVYNLTYTFKGKFKNSESTFKVTVKEDKTTLELQDVSLYEGQTFDLDSPFKNVTDKDGNRLSAKDIEWYYIDEKKTKSLDTSEPGTHKVRLVYLDATGKWKYSGSSIITVKEDKTTLELQDVNLYEGQTFDLGSPFKNVTDKDGKKISAKDITGYYIDGKQSKELDTTKAGIHKVKISYQDATGKWLYSNEVTITVKVAWGTSPWSFDSSTGTLIIEPGSLAIWKESPWNRIDDYRIEADLIKKIVFNGTTFAPSNSNYLFTTMFSGDNKYPKNLVEIEGLSKLNTSNVTSMAHMFHNLRSLKSLDLSKFNTEKVVDMSFLFSGLSGLTDLNLSYFNTAAVIDMHSMFDNSSNLKSLNLENFDTSKVTDMNSMFEYNYKLESLDLSSFDTSNVINMSSMFASVTLKQLTLGEKFKFLPDASLSSPKASNSGDKVTGNWIRADGNSKGYAPADFMTNYGKGDLTSGVYVAEIVGELSFKEIPKNLSFKDSFISVFTTTVERKEENWEVLVEDTRINKQPWNLTVQQITPFESVDGDSLNQILLYRQDGQEDKIIDTINSVQVFKANGTQQTSYQISWAKNEGFFLKVPPGTAKAKQYQTELQWNLEDTPI